MTKTRNAKKILLLVEKQWNLLMMNYSHSFQMDFADCQISEGEVQESKYIYISE